MKALCVLALLLVSPLAADPVYRPYRLQGLSGSASLIRYDSLWPLELGEQIPADFVFRLQAGAWAHFRINGRIDFYAAGPAEFRGILVDPAKEGAKAGDLALKLERGDYLFDTRFLLDHPSQLHLDLPDRNFELMGATRCALSVDALEQSQLGRENPTLAAQDALPVKALLVVREYDEELNRWARPPILAPALLRALTPLAGLSFVEGSGERKLALSCNGALKSGNDPYLSSLARQRGARFLITGNMVSQEVEGEAPEHGSFIVATSELRVLECDGGDEVVINDLASTSVARAARSLEIVDRRMMHASADKIGQYLSDDLRGLLLGQSHPPVLVKVSFNGVRPEWQHELRQGLGGLPSVQRYFRRGYSQGLFRLDVILRKDEDDFVTQLEAYPFEAFRLEADRDSFSHSLVYTLRQRRPSPKLALSPGP